MQKRTLFTGILGILVLAVGTGLLIFSKKPVTKPLESFQTGSTQTPAVKLLTWDDPAGFTFTYPEELVLNKHDEDNENYAHVELTSKDHPGSLVVWAKDTNASDVTAWVRTEREFAGATIIDTTLGNQPAKKIISGDKKLITGTTYDDLLFFIDTMPTDASFWSKIHDVVANSFSFKVQAAGGGVSGEAVDEEEVVQ